MFIVNLALGATLLTIGVTGLAKGHTGGQKKMDIANIAIAVFDFVGVALKLLEVW